MEAYPMDGDPGWVAEGSGVRESLHRSDPFHCSEQMKRLGRSSLENELSFVAKMEEANHKALRNGALCVLVYKCVLNMSNFWQGDWANPNWQQFDKSLSSCIYFMQTCK